MQKFITNKTKKPDSTCGLVNLVVGFLKIILCHPGWQTKVWMLLSKLWGPYLFLHTSLEMRRWWLFLMRTLTGLWTSSEDVPDAWSLSPSEPIFTFSWTMPGRHTDAHCNYVEFRCLIQLRHPWWFFSFCFFYLCITVPRSIEWQIFCSFRNQRSDQHNVFKSLPCSDVSWLCIK